MSRDSARERETLVFQLNDKWLRNPIEGLMGVVDHGNETGDFALPESLQRKFGAPNLSAILLRVPRLYLIRLRNWCGDLRTMLCGCDCRGNRFYGKEKGCWQWNVTSVIWDN